MTGTAASPQPLVVGANHRSSSMMLRDRLFVEESGAPFFLTDLKAAGVEQALILATCDRVEVQAVHPDPDAAAAAVRRVLAGHAGLNAGELEGQVYSLTGAEALRQMFAVAASLDSLMIGEPQVLGQVKDAYRQARDAGSVGPELETLMQAVLACAKRVRTETRIGEGPVSIAAAAVQLARDLHGDLDRCSGLVIGGGDMGELVGADLAAGGLKQLTAVHPTDSRARAIAHSLDCHVAPFDDLESLLAGSDVVLTALGARQHTVTAAMIDAALRARKRKPMFLIDTGIPGDVDPGAQALDGAFLYDLNDLERVAMEGRASREAEARAAWRIVEAEIDGFRRGRAERTAVPALADLRHRFEAAREAALADAGGDADKATRLLVNRLLHDPSEVLRAAAAADDADWSEMERLLQRLFRLNEETKP